MDPIISHLLAGAGGLVLGGLLAWLFLRRGTSAGANAEKQLDDYRREVAEHFARTSQLVDGMTDSYKAVFDELQEGAHKLMAPEQLKDLLADQSEEVITLSRLSYRAAPAAAAADPSSPESAPAPADEDAPDSGEDSPQDEAQASAKDRPAGPATGT